MNVLDGQFHQLAIYCVDWDSTERVQRVDVLNAVTGAVLDTRTVGAFNGGQWLVWNVTGGITLRVTTVAGVNGVIQGIFFGGTPNTAPAVTLTGPASGASFTAPATVPLTATATDTDGTIALVEFFQGTTKIGDDATAPYSFSWTNVPASSLRPDRARHGQLGRHHHVGGRRDHGEPGGERAADGQYHRAGERRDVHCTGERVDPATAGDTDGTVSRVEFFQGTTKLGEDLTAPYTYSWTGVAAGAYNLTARATG